MSKRKKFVLVSLVLGVGLVLTQLVQEVWRYQAIAVLGIVAYGLSAWSLKGDLKGVEWLTVMVLPTIYPIAVGLFYFLLPQQVLSRVFILGLFGIGMYALLLTANILSVAAIRTIQLLRAAVAVGFLLTLVTAFLLLDTVLSFRLVAGWNLALVAGVSWPLLLNGLWSMELTESKISLRVWLYSGVLAVLLGGVGWAISFWPLSVAVGSLFLVSMLYVGLGLTQQYFTGRLFENTFKEYIAVGAVVLVVVMTMTRWGG